MQIFISSNFKLDKSIALIKLDIDNLDDVCNEDIILGLGTFRDELIFKELINRGVFPFFISIQKDNIISNLYYKFSLVLSVENLTINQKLLEKVSSLKKMFYSLEKSIQSFEQDNLLSELLIYTQYLIASSIISSEQRSATKEKIDESLEKIYIYNKVATKNTIYVVLQQENYLKVFRAEVDKDIKIKKEMLINKFYIKFKRLMTKHQNSYSFRGYDFENITLKYGDDFLIINQKNKTLLSLSLSDNRLIFLEKIDFLQIAFYRLYQRKIEIDKQRESLLYSLHKYLNKENQAIQNIEPFLMARNLYQTIRDEEERKNLVSDVFIKLVSKIEKERTETKTTYFHFAMIVLKDSFEMDNKHLLTNIFYHIVDGLGIDNMIKKEFVGFVKNFNKYRNTVHKVEEYLEDNEECYAMDDYIYDFTHNERTLNIKYIEILRYCLDKDNKWRKELDNLYYQLDYQEVSYDIELLSDKTNQENIFLKKNSYEEFLELILGTLFRMKGFDSISPKKLTLFLSYVAYVLSINDDSDKSIDCCYFSFFTIYADKNPTFLLLTLEKYFKSRVVPIMKFSKERALYSCDGDKENIVIVMQDGEKKEIRCNKFRNLKSRRLSLSLKTIGKFYQFLSSQGDIDNIIQESINNIIISSIETEKLCQNEITLNFLAIFLNTKQNCNHNILNFLSCFKDEYYSINAHLVK